MSDASKRTLRRSDELAQHRHVASGGGDLAQLTHEVKLLGPDQRRQLIGDMEIPSLTSLALKADLCPISITQTM